MEGIWWAIKKEQKNKTQLAAVIEIISKDFLFEKEREKEKVLLQLQKSAWHQKLKAAKNRWNQQMVRCGWKWSWCFYFDIPNSRRDKFSCSRKKIEIEDFWKMNK